MTAKESAKAQAEAGEVMHQILRAAIGESEITRLRQAKDATETKMIEARRNLSAAQSAYAKARKEERAALLAYVEAMEAKQSTTMGESK